MNNKIVEEALFVIKQKGNKAEIEAQKTLNKMKEAMGIDYKKLIKNA